MLAKYCSYAFVTRIKEVVYASLWGCVWNLKWADFTLSFKWYYNNRILLKQIRFLKRQVSRKKAIYK